MFEDITHASVLSEKKTTLPKVMSHAEMIVTYNLSQMSQSTL